VPSSAGNSPGKLIVMNIRKTLSDRRAARLQKKQDKLQYLLSTTPEQRKADRQIRRLEKSIERIQAIRNWQPFNIRPVRWYEQRKIDALDAAENTGPVSKVVQPTHDGHFEVAPVTA
jgi:hypothetical protein